MAFLSPACALSVDVVTMVANWNIDSVNLAEGFHHMRLGGLGMSGIESWVVTDHVFIISMSWWWWSNHCVTIIAALALAV